MDLNRVLIVLQAFCCLSAAELAAQRDTPRAVISAVLSEVSAGLREDSDALVDGPIAFDPRIVRAPRGPAPAGWPDSVALKWVGDVRDSAFDSHEVMSLLADADGARVGPVRWLPCSPESRPGSRRCSLKAFPAVVAVSEPWIYGDVAQVLVYAWYRSSTHAHPNAFFATLVRLRRADGRWTAERWYNQAGN